MFLVKSIAFDNLKKNKLNEKYITLLTLNLIIRKWLIVQVN